jgi:hypothetical protein
MRGGAVEFCSDTVLVGVAAITAIRVPFREDRGLPGEGD